MVILRKVGPGKSETLFLILTPSRASLGSWKGRTGKKWLKRITTSPLTTSPSIVPFVRTKSILTFLSTQCYNFNYIVVPVKNFLLSVFPKSKNKNYSIYNYVTGRHTGKFMSKP